jgi:hypothetical protein
MTFDDSYYRLAASRHADVPPLTPQQLEVVDLVNAIANRPDVQLTWQLEPGDLQLLNNHTVLHTRDAWLDHEVGLFLSLMKTHDVFFCLLSMRQLLVPDSDLQRLSGGPACLW